MIGRFLLALAGQSFGWTADTTSTSIQNMGVDHRRANVLVPQEFLHGADVVAVSQILLMNSLHGALSSPGPCLPSPHER